MDSKNHHAVKLLNTALENKTYFRFTDDEIRDLVAKYWHDFKIACSILHNDAINKTMNNVFKLIADYKSIDEWTELLTEVEKVCSAVTAIEYRQIFQFYIYVHHSTHLKQ